MITHRPVIGSLRNSGKAILLEDDRGHPRRVSSPETLNCTSSGANVKIFPPGSSNLRTEGILVQPCHGRLPGAVINCHYIEPTGTLTDMPFRQKSLRRANHHVLFFPLVIPSSGSAGKSSRMVRVLTSTNASVLPS